MRLPTPGDLRHRLRLEAATRSADGGGGAIVTWALVGEVWASVKDTAGGEQIAAGGLQGHLTREVWIRYRADAAPAMRFAEGARLFDIQSVLDPDGRRRWLRCLCAERVG